MLVVMSVVEMVVVVSASCILLYRQVGGDV